MARIHLGEDAFQLGTGFHSCLHHVHFLGADLRSFPVLGYTLNNLHAFEGDIDNPGGANGTPKCVLGQPRKGCCLKDVEARPIGNLKVYALGDRLVSVTCSDGTQGGIYVSRVALPEAAPEAQHRILLCCYVRGKLRCVQTRNAPPKGVRLQTRGHDKSVNDSIAFAGFMEPRGRERE